MTYIKRAYKGFFSLSTPDNGNKIRMILGEDVDLNVTFIGRYQLIYDAGQTYIKKSSPSYSVGIIGLVLNPIDGVLETQEIVDKLYEKLTISEGYFFDYIDKLSGSFIIFYRINEKVFVLQDACATKLCYSFFEQQTEQVCISSHIVLLAKLFNLNESVTSRTVMKHPDYAKEVSKYLPGLLTPYEKIKPLIANNYFDMQKGELGRFYPRKNLNALKLSNELVERLAGIFKLQAEMISSKGPVAIAVTGGKDSRVTLSAFSSLDPESFCFTFWNSKSNQFLNDLNISKDLLKITNFTHKVFDISQYGSNVKSVIPLRSPMGIWPSAADLYESNFSEECIHVRSTVSEVGRCFYNRERGSSEISAKRLANSFTTSVYANSSDLEQVFSEYIKYTSFSTKNIFNYDPLDLYYWEHRNSKWQNILCHEAELAGRVFIPFNNRYILELFLSIPALDRQNAELHKKLITHMAPKFDDVEVDSLA